MEYKEDLRIQKTRRDLRGAIIELIKQKPIEKISVKEICDTALITRMTFYKYYEDKYQLLDDTFIEVKDQILASVPTQEVTSIEDATKYTCELIIAVINFIQKNFDIIQALKKNSNNEIMEMITNISEGAISELLDKASKTFKGTLDFRTGSTGSAGDEQEDTLLLSPDVVNRTMPVILCQEEDVDGRHGATIGQLGEDTLFYMESRGISEEEAKKIMVKARLDSIANMIPDDDIRTNAIYFIQESL